MMTGITRELKDKFTPNMISFSVNVEDLSSVTFYSGEFIYAVIFIYKNGLRRQYGDIIGNRVNVIRTIDLQNKKIMKYDFGFHNGKIDNLQLLLYDPLENIHYWTAKLSKNKRDESLKVDQTFNWSSYVEYISFEGCIDGESLRDWRMKYMQKACSEFTTSTTTTTTTTTTYTTIVTTTSTKTATQSPTTIKLMPTPDMFSCRQPFNIPMMKSKKFGHSLSYEKIYEYTASSVYYCSCSCSAGEHFGTFFTCSIYEFNMKTRKCILYSINDYDAVPLKIINFLADYDYISGFTHLKGTSTRTVTNITKNGNGDNLGRLYKINNK